MWLPFLFGVSGGEAAFQVFCGRPGGPAASRILFVDKGSMGFDAASPVVLLGRSLHIPVELMQTMGFSMCWYSLLTTIAFSPMREKHPLRWRQVIHGL